MKKGQCIILFNPVFGHIHFVFQGENALSATMTGMSGLCKHSSAYTLIHICGCTRGMRNNMWAHMLGCSCTGRAKPSQKLKEGLVCFHECIASHLCAMECTDTASR